MPANYLQQIWVLIKRLFIAYLAYFFCRVLFYTANLRQFPNTGISDLLADAFYGLRFDSFSIALSNSLFILLSILPVKYYYRVGYQGLLRFLFIFMNALFLAPSFVDVGYFPFTHKRANSDLFYQLGGQSDMLNLIPRFAIDYWWILLLYVFTIAGMYMLYKKIRITCLESKTGLKEKIIIALLFILCSGLTTLAIRGGVQRSPIDIVNAGAVASQEQVPIVLNSSFTLIKTINQQPLQELNFYTPAELKKYTDPVHHYRDSVFSRRNLVVLILESFSKEYTALGRKPGLTPFLDSLMQHSLVMTNGFANGTKSIEGIPAILSGLPSLMESPFINSMYANNYQTSFATLLNREGYTTAFFHGGINGTMNFDSWAKSAGYMAYYGQNEYLNNDDFDGYWGIWDEPFLQFSIQKMNGFKQPFHSAVFTLSSHHPYFVPKKYEHMFKGGQLENAASIRYADFSLRQFFETAKKTPWYNNTLFVLVADHAGISEDPFYATVAGNLTIPVLFFDPQKKMAGSYSGIFSHIDLLPSTMALMGYNKPFFAFGKSFTEAGKKMSFYYVNGSHFHFMDSMMYRYNGEELLTVSNIRRDSSLSTYVNNRYPHLEIESKQQYRAFMQLYNHTLIHNAGYLTHE